MGFPSLSQAKVPPTTTIFLFIESLFYFQKQTDKHYGHKPCDLRGRFQVLIFQYSDKNRPVSSVCSEDCCEGQLLHSRNLVSRARIQLSGRVFS